MLTIKGLKKNGIDKKGRIEGATEWSRWSRIPKRKRELKYNKTSVSINVSSILPIHTNQQQTIKNFNIEIEESDDLKNISTV